MVEGCAINEYKTQKEIGGITMNIINILRNSCFRRGGGADTLIYYHKA